MTDISSRVNQCFLNVFPGLETKDLPGANQAGLTEWDSVAHVTLLSAIGEEFQIDIEDEAFESLTSYSLVVDFVEKQLAGK